MKQGDRVRCSSPQTAKTVGTVKKITEATDPNTPTVQVEFTGAEWFYPYVTWFRPDELEIVAVGIR